MNRDSFLADISRVGVPFYPEGETPMAPCPRCMSERNDNGEKMLFFINGVREGEFDPRIPESFFKVPPVQLDEKKPGYEALRVRLYTSIWPIKIHLFLVPILINCSLRHRYVYEQY